MRLLELKCHNCNADLVLDMEHMLTSCPYCGDKILIDSASLSKILSEREKTNRVRIQNEHTEKMFYARAEEREREAQRKARENRRKFFYGDGARFLLIFCMPILLAILLFAGLGAISGSEEARYGMPVLSSDAEGKKTTTIYEMLYAQGFTNIKMDVSSDLSGTKKQINDGEVIRILVNGSSEYDLEPMFRYHSDASIVIVFYSSDGKLPFPYSSKDIKGQDAEEVKVKLIRMGFSNVQVSEKTGLFNGPKGKITKMTVNGEKKFGTDMRVDIGAPIVIEKGK